MVRRWLIRSLALTLLTLCVVAWVGSYFESMMVTFGGNTRLWCSSLRGGELDLTYQNQSPIPFSGWAVEFDQCDGVDRAVTRATYEAMPHQLLGFAWRPHKEYWVDLMIPLWFPTMLAAGLFWLIWRKTRPKYSGRAFPVEPAEIPVDSK